MGLQANQLSGDAEEIATEIKKKKKKKKKV
jgi:hypothetical protein